MRIARVGSTRARRFAAAGAAGALLLALTACVNNGGAVTDQQAQCAPSQRKALPTATNVLSVKDDRYGDIYACMFFLDMGVPFNTVTPLVRIDEKQVQSSEFSLRGDIGGGFLFFGLLGELEGRVDAQGRTITKDVYLAVFTDADGTEQRIYLDAEKVKIRRYKPGSTNKVGEPNVPSITFEIPGDPLFYRDNRIDIGGGTDEPDTYSLWMFHADDSDYFGDRPDNAAKRLLVLEHVSTVSQADRAYDLGNHLGVTGGPRSVSEVVSALSTRIIVDLPQDTTPEEAAAK